MMTITRMINANSVEATIHAIIIVPIIDPFVVASAMCSILVGRLLPFTLHHWHVAHPMLLLGLLLGRQI